MWRLSEGRENSPQSNQAADAVAIGVDVRHNEKLPVPTDGLDYLIYYRFGTLAVHSNFL